MSLQIAIIESLQAGDTLTGKTLFDVLHSRNVDVTYTNAENLDGFLRAIQAVALESRIYGTRRSLHFEVHGGRSGFELTDGARVDWSAIKTDLQSINIAQKGHLLVTMAVCDGFWLREIIQATDRSPFRYLVGCPSSVYEGSIVRSFPRFYETLEQGGTAEVAVKELNLLQNGQNDDYNLLDAERIFAIAYAKYLGISSAPEALSARVDAMASYLVDIGICPFSEKSSLKQYLLACLKTEEESNFERFREKYFLHDLYSENMAEFCPTFEYCKQLGNMISENRSKP